MFQAQEHMKQMMFTQLKNIQNNFGPLIETIDMPSLKLSSTQDLQITRFQVKLSKNRNINLV